MCDKEQERDELRARFTAWMKVLAYRTRRKYLTARSPRVRQISLEQLSEELLPAGETPIASFEKAFDFEENSLAEAFSQLPERKKQVLTLAFAQGLMPAEIAKELGCDVHNVYKHQSMALKLLRESLKGDEKNGQ